MEPSRLNYERWESMSFMEQMANIGSEVGRTCKWVEKSKPAMAESAFCRALELIDLTLKYGRLDSPLRAPMLKELCRLRECFCAAYDTTDKPSLLWLDNYFSAFAVSQRR